MPATTAPAVTYGIGATVPAPGAYTVTPPSRGALVHYSHVGDYVNATDFPEYRQRGTSCGKPIRATWAVTPVDAATAVATVTCPSCHGWAKYHADEPAGTEAEQTAATTYLAARAADLSPTWQRAVDQVTAVHTRDAARYPAAFEQAEAPAGITCPRCGGATIAPTPGRPEEIGDYCEACGIAWDPARVAANAAAEPERCEHGRPMDEPCGPCAVAGHEPVDVEPEHSDDECPSPTCTERHAAPFPSMDEPEPLTDAYRHLADCRGCALLLPDGHEYASLIEVPPTADELRTLAARSDVDPRVRQVAADVLAELHADAEWMDRLAAQTDAEAAAEGWVADSPTA